ncbi:MAG: prepilin-type N-terminal cleavage/methylation domain-containing protein [Candidatus Omnitrophica bacterium]|nr:prepilin-type N-terminal cleavage/methylation domain-containing protein [Candidatus Omnitrophota bacterium]
MLSVLGLYSWNKQGNDIEVLRKRQDFDVVVFGGVALMRLSSFHPRRAFTMVELVFVVIVIGILASIALPRFSNTVEKSRIMEAVNILATLRDAQELYRQEKGAYTAVLDNLDVTIAAPANFAMPTVAAADPIASIVRNAGGYQYTLTIDADGTVSCGGTVNPANICATLGCAGGTCN